MTTNYRDIFDNIKTLANLHPQVNYFSYGLIYDINNAPGPVQVKYPYLYIILDNPHLLEYTESNGYKAIEYSFTFRVGDQVNNDVDVPSGNVIDIQNDTFSILMDFINSISNNSLNLFDDISLIDDITIEPFFNEDNGNVSGNQAILTFRVENDKQCVTPLMD